MFCFNGFLGTDELAILNFVLFLNMCASIGLIISQYDYVRALRLQRSITHMVHVWHIYLHLGPL